MYLKALLPFPIKKISKGDFSLVYVSVIVFLPADLSPSAPGLFYIYKSLNGLSPLYIADLLHPSILRWPRRSTAEMLLNVS